ncbi:MAG TPA: alpha-amylase family glycosyl hydrolase [Candidatus Dormibacteraeota bacterium]
MSSRSPSSLAATDLDIWAPHAGRVDVEVEGGGELKHGTRYAIRLDGDDPLPDPRSPWQPDGVHAYSAWVDHSLFEWHDAGWAAGTLADQVFYELHTGTFSASADFDGVIGRLDHLLELGITAIELMPVAEFAGARGWGYEGVQLFAPHHAYGGPDGLKRLVDACHARGLAVVLDVVYNHLGPEGNYLPRFGPYLTDSHQTAWGSAFNFDGPNSAEVRRFVVDNAVMWLRDYHLDGLRLDAVHAIFDDSPIHILAELAAAVRQLERPRWLIAECNYLEPKLVGEYGLDAQWDDAFHHALHAYVTGERQGYYAPFGSLPDVERALRRGSGRLVDFAQNHDQVGNRAQGDRLSATLSPGLLRCVAAVVLAGPGVPLLFQGEEWGASTPFQFFCDHSDPQIRSATTAGRIRELATFGSAAAEVPDPEDVATWERSRLDWSELERSEHARLFEWYRELVKLRPLLKETPAITVDGGRLVIARPGLTVVCDFANGEVQLQKT